MIHVFDGMAVLRRRFDTDILGNGPRKVFQEMLQLPRGDVALWCFEGRGAKFVRQDILAGYKNRPSNMTDGLHALVDLTRQTLAHTRAIQISVPRREADDVIAHLCGVYGASTPVTVHTVDRDLLALQTGLVTVDVKPLTIIVDENDPSRDVLVRPGEIHLYKTLVGDPSDRVPGMRGFGAKAFAACDRRLLAVAMQALVAERPQAALFERAGVKPAMAARICEQAEHIRACWAVTDFLPLPSDWEDGIQAGTPNPAAGDAVLRQFMH